MFIDINFFFTFHYITEKVIHEFKKRNTHNDVKLNF